MTLRNYVNRRGRTALAEALDTSPAYLSQLLGGHRRITAEMAVRIERATNGEVTRHDLRPDIFPAEYKRRSTDRKQAA